MNHVTIKVQPETMEVLLLELRDVAANCGKVPHAVSGICTVVANLIAFSGSNGGTAQANMMRMAERCGFTPEFYGHGVRVSYTAPDRKAVSFGKGQKKSAAG